MSKLTQAELSSQLDKWCNGILNRDMDKDTRTINQLKEIVEDYERLKATIDMFDEGLCELREKKTIRHEDVKKLIQDTQLITHHIRHTPE